MGRTAVASATQCVDILAAEEVGVCRAAGVAVSSPLLFPHQGPCEYVHDEDEQQLQVVSPVAVPAPPARVCGGWECVCVDLVRPGSMCSCGGGLWPSSGCSTLWPFLCWAQPFCATWPRYVWAACLQPFAELPGLRLLSVQGPRVLGRPAAWLCCEAILFVAVECTHSRVLMRCRAAGPPHPHAVQGGCADVEHPCPPASMTAVQAALVRSCSRWCAWPWNTAPVLPSSGRALVCICGWQLVACTWYCACRFQACRQL
jgi:hypothetical protein